MEVGSDFLLPLLLKNQSDTHSDTRDQKESLVILIISLFVSLFILILFMPYTIILINATRSRRYVTGDFLYDKQINDHISLMKNIQIVCGYSFTLIYCNLYFWIATDKTDYFGKPQFYEETIIPDYVINHGISLFMITKVLLIIVFAYFTYKVEKFSIFFENDLKDYNNKVSGKNFNEVILMKKFEDDKNKKKNIVDYLEKKNN